MIERRYLLDDDAERHAALNADVLVGGSPLKLFRLTRAGGDVVDRIEAGDAVADSKLVRALLDAGAVHPAPEASGAYTAEHVTIVVPTYGSPAAHLPPGAIVVDDGSEPPLPDATIRLAPNRGPGAARNAGLDHVTTPLVAFVDADVRLPDGWLAPLLPHFDDDRVAVVAPRVRSAPGTSARASYEWANSPLDLGDRAARVRAGSRVSYVPAAAIVCRVDAVRELGGFDETLRLGEDVDLVWRLDDTGWRVRYEPAVSVFHDPRPTWWAWLAQRVGYGASAAPLARRHPGALAPLRMSGWSVATWVLAVGVHPVIGAMVGAGSASALVRKLSDVPPAAAFGLAWRGNLHAGRQIATAVRRAWWPVLLVVGVRSRRARRALLLSAIAAGHPLRLLDDLAYSVGVWRGVITARTLGPLLPEISSWPGRRATVPPSAAR